MPAIEDAFHRLQAALSRLEAVVARRIEADTARGDHETELALMDEDRARLAAELDRASARLARMNAVTDDVERKIGRAIDTVESVVARRDGAARPGVR